MRMKDVSCAIIDVVIGIDGDDEACCGCDCSDFDGCCVWGCG